MYHLATTIIAFHPIPLTLSMFKGNVHSETH